MSNEPAVLERSRELDRFCEALRLARSGHGRVLVIEGPSGIGKTRLLAEARGLASEIGLRVLHARAGELERDYAFGVVLGLLDPVVASATTERREFMLRGRASLAAPLLDGMDDGTRRVALNDEHSLLHGLYWCLVNLTEEQPTALVIDDVHWADQPSLRFLVYLAQRLADLPLAMIAAIRNGDPAEEPELVTRLVDASSAPTVRPAELSLDASRELLVEALPDALGDDFVQASWEATRGNPFLLREIVSEVLADPVAWRENAAARVAAFAPHSVSRNVALRLTRLGPDALLLAQARAVLGDGYPLVIATALAGLDGPAAATATERLIDANILSGAETIAFSHPMIRSAVYEGLGSAERSAMHVTAALLLHRSGATAEIVAHHLLAGTPTSAGWALATLHDAARAAARKGSPKSAVRLLRRAVELCPDDRAAPLLIDLGLAEAAAGELTALGRFEEALSILDDRQERIRAMYALGQTLYRYGRHDEAATIFRRGAELTRNDPSAMLTFEAGFMCAAQYVVALRPELRARLRAQGDLRSRSRGTTADRALLANLALDTAMSVGDQPATWTAELAQHALDDDALFRAEGSESMAMNLAILALLWSGRPGDAQRAIDLVLADARERGATLAFAEASMVRALIMYTRGQLAEAAADAQAAIHGMERGWHSGVPAPQSVLAQCLIERGEVDRAAAVLREVAPLLGSVATRGMKAWFYAARGRLRLERRDAPGAYADFLAAGECLDEYLAPASPALIPWRSLAGLAACAAGDRKGALALIDHELALARQLCLPAQLGAALRRRGTVEAGPEALVHLTAAVAALEVADSQLELGRALLELGSRQRRSGAVTEARENLRRALDLTHRGGATAIAERAREELLASGARPRRHVLTGVASLTPSERRIAEQAAAGHTARAIAEELFLSKHTVEWHLRRVYRKLDVCSRVELREKLDGHHSGSPVR
ncbi:ATP-binding protein [Pseudonocardia asaccharolytica]|uniref:HTH luxR-type domain-containing protein n=1 Tax=Pseudonocardia asaccharolytica DSM 44247 = NBRC 16224 TaxID=1123024 RepID=A0A511CXC5_9PSEU|nr:LuxR family transcriptional regulator [Pseudonocardia asaccharolytica]GEL17216.1 hypothetical protein PA7_10530 [Pseudonocardia asaccharolytica DSM 44247 = NBRC 16224]